VIRTLLARMDADHWLRPGFGEYTALLLGGVLLAMLGWSVLNLGVLVQLVVMLSAVMAITFFTRPEYALLIFFAMRAIFDLLWWIPGTILSLNMMELFTGAVTGLAAVMFVLDLKRLDWHPCLPAFIPYVTVILIGGVRDLAFRSGAEITARYVSPLLIMFLMSAYFDSRFRRRRLFLVATAVGVIPVVVSLYKLSQGQMHTYYLAGYWRLLGGYKNLHNHALMMMFITTMVAWWFMRTQDRAWKAMLLVYGLGSVSCMYLTYARTAYLGLAVFFAVYFYVTGQRRLLAAGAVALVIFVMSSSMMQDRFKDLVYFFMTEEESGFLRRKLGSGRWGLWTSSFREYLRHPLGDIVLGLGIGKHWLLTRQYFNPYAIAQQGFVDPHNDYLTMTYQVGPIATLSYLAMQVQAVRYGLRVYRWSDDAWSRSLGAYVVGLCATATVANSVSNAFINRTTLGWYFWGIAGLMFAEYGRLARITDEGRRRPPINPPQPTPSRSSDRNGGPAG